MKNSELHKMMKTGKQLDELYLKMNKHNEAMPQVAIGLIVAIFLLLIASCGI